MMSRLELWEKRWCTLRNLDGAVDFMRQSSAVTELGGVEKASVSANAPRLPGQTTFTVCIGCGACAFTHATSLRCCIYIS